MRMHHVVILTLLIAGVITGPADAQDYRVYRGCVHIHSVYSDGGGTVEDIMQAAQDANLDYAVLTDHNTLEPLRDGHEGWYGNSLLLIGTELSLPDGHYLALGVPADFTWDDNDTQTAVHQVSSAGGFGFLAHPISRWPWTDWDVTGYTGMELTNLSSLFHQEGLSQPVALLLDFVRDYLTNSSRAMQRVLSTASDGSLEHWADLLSRRRTVGIGSVDAHALIVVGRSTFRVPPYVDMFRGLQIHILVPEAFNRNLAHDRQLVYDALRDGRCYTAYTIWGDAMGFQFTASRSGASAVMGQSISRNGRLVTLRVRVPTNDRITTRLFHGTREVLSTSRRDIVFPAPVSGPYRAEVDLHRNGRRVPWIISNPIYVE